MPKLYVMQKQISQLWYHYSFDPHKRFSKFNVFFGIGWCPCLEVPACGSTTLLGPSYSVTLFPWSYAMFLVLVHLLEPRSVHLLGMLLMGEKIENLCHIVTGCFTLPTVCYQYWYIGPMLVFFGSANASIANMASGQIGWEKSHSLAIDWIILCNNFVSFIELRNCNYFITRSKKFMS